MLFSWSRSCIRLLHWSTLDSLRLAWLKRPAVRSDLLPYSAVVHAQMLHGAVLFSNIYLWNNPNVGKYTIHIAFGMGLSANDEFAWLVSYGNSCMALDNDQDWFFPGLSKSYRSHSRKGSNMWGVCNCWGWSLAKRDGLRLRTSPPLSWDGLCRMLYIATTTVFLLNLRNSCGPSLVTMTNDRSASGTPWYVSLLRRSAKVSLTAIKATCGPWGVCSTRCWVSKSCRNCAVNHRERCWQCIVPPP